MCTCVHRGTANICICFVIWMLALLCAYFDVLFSSFLNFKRDLYKCLAAGSLKAAERHAKGQTDQTGQSEICSKPYISLALVSYWMVRPFSLHAALQTQPEGQDWSVLTSMVDNRDTVDHCVYLFACLQLSIWWATLLPQSFLRYF